MSNHVKNEYFTYTTTQTRMTTFHYFYWDLMPIIHVSAIGHIHKIYGIYDKLIHLFKTACDVSESKI